MRRKTTALGLVCCAALAAIPGVARAERCNDGTHATPRARERDAAPPTLEDDTCFERDIYFMPGAQAVTFVPAAKLGVFYGAGVQLAPLQISHNNDRFGATFGGLTQADLGTSAYAYALGGVHLYWHHNLMLDAEGGYHFPFEDVDRVRGPRGQISMRFSLW